MRGGGRRMTRQWKYSLPPWPQESGQLDEAGKLIRIGLQWFSRLLVDARFQRAEERSVDLRIQPLDLLLAPARDFGADEFGQHSFQFIPLVLQLPENVRQFLAHRAKELGILRGVNPVVMPQGMPHLRGPGAARAATRDARVKFDVRNVDSNAAMLAGRCGRERFRRRTPACGCGRGTGTR
jgi:hypothetical protein